MAQEITLDGLEILIEKSIQEVLVAIAEKTAQKLYSIVENDWYTQHGNYGQFYDRTYDLLKSITTSNVRKVGNSYEVEIYFDSSKIHSRLVDDPNKFNAHMSVNGDTSWDGESISTLLPYWIEYGQNSSINPESGIHMVEETKQWLETEFMKMAMQQFRAKGFEISVR